MPAPALPIPHGTESDRKPFRRTYADPLGEPMTGKVTVTTLRRLDQDATVTPEASAAVVELVDGVLEVFLLPGYYKLVAELISPSGHTVTDTDTITFAG